MVPEAAAGTNTPPGRVGAQARSPDRRCDRVRCSRLILEAGPNAVTVRFHPNLTVIAGVGRLERDSLVGELLSALAGGRSGTHLEVLDRTGRRLAVVRAGKGAPDRVVDLATREDVTEEF